MSVKYLNNLMCMDDYDDEQLSIPNNELEF